LIEDEDEDEELKNRLTRCPVKRAIIGLVNQVSNDLIDMHSFWSIFKLYKKQQ